MKLYVFPVAPNPTKVRLFLAEKRAGGAPVEVEEVPVDLPKGEQKRGRIAELNPFRRIPVLEFDDGSCLIESLPIMEYLEELHPEPPLIGRTPRERARIRELERIADQGVLVPVARIVHATNSPIGLPANPAVAEYHRELLARPLRYLDDVLSDGRPFVAGDGPSIADCTLAAALQFARFGKVELDPDREQIAAWDARFRQRESARPVLVL